MLFLYILGGILVLLILLAIIAPKNYHVQRSIVIDRSVSEVFNYIKFIKNQDEWSPWKKRDPNMIQNFEGTDGEVGFISKWAGNKDVGTGEQEILTVHQNDRIESKLRFLKPWKSESDAFIKTETSGNDQTKVTWGFSGKNKVPINIFMMLYNVDKHVGKDFNEGLECLKEILETK
ncbi:SRPBCC family protein [Psychroserpens sp.]|uniref:SRPBCC family protein n=1 Tax=Psychroserpens sp. TaxID=2020870 RepID=UPI001B060D02|nr:SRPBCC family protein [Psychroserpens sp.]MBO6607595.1 SRPBCC family protein [Psychroserpens sp.]MBO6631569.1 SRPBCC family protein [Psychroserpens sp.]MBO6655093.1 SRPBCC family protein [Psychroserpens sp.]MBO6683102.1 SRPBCC family protein [Psychroserpens sp.]MBO6749719.1 SRPBCC family protein [Psychroserpens sp.]